MLYHLSTPAGPLREVIYVQKGPAQWSTSDPMTALQCKNVPPTIPDLLGVAFQSGGQAMTA